MSTTLQSRGRRAWDAPARRVRAPPSIALGARGVLLDGDGDGDPNNVRFAPRGSAYFRHDVPELWQNVDGVRTWVLCCPAPTQMVVGSYIGNGNASRDIVGLPFTPRHVQVWFLAGEAGDPSNLGHHVGNADASDAFTSVGVYGTEIGSPPFFPGTMDASMGHGAIAVSPNAPVANGFRVFLLSGLNGANRLGVNHRFTAWK